MVFYFIAIAVMAYAFINFKKAFLLFLLFKTVLVTNITFLAVPGLPLLTVDTFVTFFFLMLFIVKRKKYMTKDDKNFPFKKPFLFLVFSGFLSTIFAIAGFYTALSQFIGNVCQLLLIWMMWVFIKDVEDVKFLVKGFSILFFAYAIYMYYEYSIQTNPLVEYENTLISEDRAIDFRYSINEERGYRSQSVFEHAIGAGINFAMYCMLIISLQIFYKIRLQKSYIISLLCATCVFLTGSRGPILFFLILCLGFVDFRKAKLCVLSLIGVVAFLVILPYLPITISNIVYSIFDPSYQDKVGGSDADMRFEQLGAAWMIMLKSPFVGLGYKFLNVTNTSLTSLLLGKESIWFNILTTFGLLGVVANIYVAYYFLLKIPKKYHSRPMFFLALAYWVTASLTSVPGMLMYFYYMIYIMFIKLSTPRLS